MASLGLPRRDSLNNFFFLLCTFYGKQTINNKGMTRGSGLGEIRRGAKNAEADRDQCKDSHTVTYLLLPLTVNNNRVLSHFIYYHAVALINMAIHKVYISA